MSIILATILISLMPFLYLFNYVAVVGNFTYAFANIAGFIGGVLLMWEFILGIKELAKKIPLESEQFIKLHIILGVWGMFFVFIHPILEMFSYVENISFLFQIDFSSVSSTQITYGRFALLLIVLVWLTSSFLRNNLSYKKWLKIHYLSYPMMFFVFFHTLSIGSYLNTFILIKVYWYILFTLFTVLCIWRLYAAFNKSDSIINYTPLQ